MSSGKLPEIYYLQTAAHGEQFGTNNQFDINHFGSLGKMHKKVAANERQIAELNFKCAKIFRVRLGWNNNLNENYKIRIRSKWHVFAKRIKEVIFMTDSTCLLVTDGSGLC